MQRVKGRPENGRKNEEAIILMMMIVELVQVIEKMVNVHYSRRVKAEVSLILETLSTTKMIMI